MDKNEILEKNREDNRGADERFRILNQRQSAVMVGAMLAMWLILFLWNVFRGLDTSQGGAIMLSGVAAMGFWQFYQFRMKFSLACGLLAAFGAATFAVKYIMGTM
ncbi:DUF6442 family protein [Gordonibacter urolithinfaciens]|uniref:DUF6442 family protein n=1 Tax=Gordonibacter urolithinfaciens TaxID=1335613 RepID=UPI003AAFD517